MAVSCPPLVLFLPGTLLSEPSKFVWAAAAVAASVSLLFQLCVGGWARAIIQVGTTFGCMLQCNTLSHSSFLMADFFQKRSSNASELGDMRLASVKHMENNLHGQSHLFLPDLNLHCGKTWCSLKTTVDFLLLFFFFFFFW